MSNKVYFNGVTEINRDDWNDVYMPAFERFLIKERLELLLSNSKFAVDVFETVLEDTDGRLYHIAAKTPKYGDTLVQVKPFVCAESSM